MESRDYYEMPKQGPDGCALRSLTASFMVAQGCQTPGKFSPHNFKSNTVLLFPNFQHFCG